MPRPGPRPYDCVRRAWHSELHQPIRGTLIQEIFRVVNEIHASSTKNNKEYQEKLPVVVLRAEEIIYSKANSQAEYMDLSTLLERTNDAIDTIIRRDELTETGEYLRPCIEAALSLGCSLTKATRSQRNNQRCYLSRSSTEEVPRLSHGDRLHNNANTKDHNTMPHYVSENLPSTGKKQCVEHQSPLKLYSVYPLYYGNNNSQQHGLKASHVSFSHNGGSAFMGGARNLNLLSHNLNSSSGGSQSSFLINRDLENPCTNKCDLSLRLGPLISVPSPNFENGGIQENSS